MHDFEAFNKNQVQFTNLLQKMPEIIGQKGA